MSPSESVCSCAGRIPFTCILSDVPVDKIRYTMDGEIAGRSDSIFDDDSDQNNISDEDVEIEDACVEGRISTSVAIAIQRNAAEFFAFVKDICKTTETTIEKIVSGVDNLFKLYNDFMKARLLELSDGESVLKSDIESLFSILDQQSLFEGVQTYYRREKYKKANWNVLIPKKIVLEWKRIILHGRVREVPDKFGYYIDFLSQLEALLQCDDILECLDNQQKLSASHLDSILDGQCYQTHEISLKFPGALAFVFYVDDVNPGDTLTSYGISFRNYLWTLANIPPELRSSLRAINMFAIAKTDVAKMCNNKAFLRNFISAMNRLSSDEGVTFMIKNKPRVFHGFCLCGVGDYPALGNIGGFKESSSKANRPCRQCMILNAELCWKYDESEVLLRTKDMHETHLKALENASSQDLEEEEDSPATPSDEVPGNPSTAYGVNSRSPLLELDYFDVTVSLPQDIMHLFLEGILSTGCRLILHDAVKEKKLPITSVNNFLDNHDYGSFKSDKPSKIKSEHLNTGLKQSSSQILMLSFLVPFIVKGHCDKAKMNNFVLLLMVFGICLSRQVTLDHAVLLRKMIRHYLSEFNSLYPGKFVSKHHFLIHLPSQLLSFGPLPETWAMRFESYHAQLSRLHSILHSAKNITFSLMSRVCSKQALLLHLHRSNFLTSSVLEKKVLHENIALADVPFKDCILSSARIISEKSVCELSGLQWYGSYLEAGSVIKIQEDSFGAVTNIYCIGEEYVLIYRKLETVCFCLELNAFEVICPRISSFSSVNITKKYNVVPEMHFTYHGSEYIIQRQNSSPKYNLLED
ncbi:Dual specificity mitogen-activated protein kinase kinase 1 [Frankliniella fusca]|uniref:Dual specificity mitogen-activated protein kinase kinase 1 n=1 Tax=Frankliniella fusca TaxID=407009 RepID=A0AAE1HUF4_9NEOP|nr:Dual specificity mitogen-activated protein kinase kinase 1 [Frankliniella fusca]